MSDAGKDATRLQLGGHFQMTKYEFTLEQAAVPYFAEVPYYLWGEANYKSDGDCKRPTDRKWTCLSLIHRETEEDLEIVYEGDEWIVEGEDPLAARCMMFLKARCGAIIKNDQDPKTSAGDWNHEAGMKRARKVAEEFGSLILKPFDSHLFWGSWKWIGWYCTDLTSAGRWIMASLLMKDPRGVPICIDWLKHGTFSDEQSEVLRYALNYLTDEEFDSDAKWIKWYEGGFLNKGAKIKYPEFDVNQWIDDLKQAYADVPRMQN